MTGTSADGAELSPVACQPELCSEAAPAAYALRGTGALMASLVPAYRALRLDPVKILRAN